MSYRLNVPTYERQVALSGLWRYVNFDVGKTLIRSGGHWTAEVTPTEDQLTDAESYYRGGYQHVISDDVAAELIADGFGANVELIP